MLSKKTDSIVSVGEKGDTGKKGTGRENIHLLGIYQFLSKVG